jgi:hypothetical protein
MSRAIPNLNYINCLEVVSDGRWYVVSPLNEFQLQRPRLVRLRKNPQNYSTSPTSAVNFSSTPRSKIFATSHGGSTSSSPYLRSSPRWSCFHDKEFPLMGCRRRRWRASAGGSGYNGWALVKILVEKYAMKTTIKNSITYMATSSTVANTDSCKFLVPTKYTWSRF